VETSNLMNYETSNLQQIRKRLELLYPESHKLHIIIEEETFIIRLEIALNRVVI
jgi:LytS/YehU family sensor histidine kinase